MSNVARINDGNRPFGSRTLSIFRPDGSLTITSKVENFTLPGPTKFSGQMGTDGAPLASISVDDFQAGSGTWQVLKDGDGNEVRLQKGDCFTQPEGNFYVDTAEVIQETQGEIKKQGFTFRPVLNPADFYVEVAGVATPVSFPIS